ncbi:MAG: quinone oxidoreductase [Acidobacteria bacterium RIFCSPLOWO2_12_FULL_66_10]|nr:MAG: quinone oxidoreductase [Acidobacteria bacterium RIFCSPLOWO2_12_FULL_66_10]
MRAIRVRAFGDPGVMQLEDVPDPKPGPGDVVVRIRAAGVNPVDAYIRTGTYPRKPPLPYTPGSDGAGEVEAVGADVRGVTTGDRVYIAGYGNMPGGAGTYAERALCSPSQLYRLPARTSFAQGAALGVPYATAYRALFQHAKATPGETVLVHGATGGVGIAAVELAHARGLTVIGSGGTDAGLAVVREHGADVTVNHRAPDHMDDVLRATGGRGVDVIIEMAAHINLDRDLTVLAKHGRVVVVGSRGPVEINPRNAMGRDAAIMGMTLFNAADRDLVEIHAALIAGLGNGTLNPAIGRELPLAEAARAHEAVLESGALGKIVLAA